jgi:hypothetical protein
VYAQESLRFAVKENLGDEVPLPPSITDPGSDNARAWFNAVQSVDEAYRYLIANGVPAEDARGLLPHSVLTRLNYCTDLRNLLDHAGNRLCTQAQFHWRAVFNQIVRAIAGYDPFGLGQPQDQWQFEHIARGGVFAPVCYEKGYCPFNADFDRGCTIRERVQANAKHGVPSSEWHLSHEFNKGRLDEIWIGGIRIEEWMLDEKAGWVR